MRVLKIKGEGREGGKREKRVGRETKGDSSVFDKRGPKVKSKHNRIYERLSE